MLPDEVLLEIFAFCADKYGSTKEVIEAWQSLVHVCRRWRSVVFGSPRRLNLRLVFTTEIPARDTPDVWPALPLAIDAFVEQETVDNIVAVLECRDRLDEITFYDADHSLLPVEKVLAAMQEPFPGLRYLVFDSSAMMMPVFPNSFLGGSIPRLQHLQLARVPFPGLPKLLLSASHLATLYLLDIPHSGYFSPEAMSNSLSMLTNLRSFCLQFESYYESRHDWGNRRSLPPTRSVLPTLTYFEFKGVCEYLDNLVAGIDAPRLNDLIISFMLPVLDMMPQLMQFISGIPTLKVLEEARVSFMGDIAMVRFSSRTRGHGELNVEVLSKESDSRVTFLQQVCSSCSLCLPPLSTLEDFFIHEVPYPVSQVYDTENDLWLGTNMFISFCEESPPIRGS